MVKYTEMFTKDGGSALWLRLIWPWWRTRVDTHWVICLPICSENKFKNIISLEDGRPKSFSTVICIFLHLARLLGFRFFFFFSNRNVYLMQPSNMKSIRLTSYSTAANVPWKSALIRSCILRTVQKAVFPGFIPQKVEFPFMLWSETDNEFHSSVTRTCGCSEWKFLFNMSQKINKCISWYTM